MTEIDQERFHFPGGEKLLALRGSAFLGDAFVEAGAADVVDAAVGEHAEELAVHVVDEHAHVRKVVEIDAGDGGDAHLAVAGGVVLDAQRGAVGLERQRDGGLESAGFVLQTAQAGKVVDDVSVVFDVAEEHGGVGGQSQFVRHLVDVEPLLRENLGGGDFLADVGMEDFGAAAGDGAKAGGLQALERFAHGKAGVAGDPVDLHGGHALQQNAGQHFARELKQLFVVFQIQIGNHPADDVQVGQVPVLRLFQILAGIFERGYVGILGPFRPPEGTELAFDHAKVGGVEVVAVDIVGLVAVPRAADGVGARHELGRRHVLE